MAVASTREYTLGMFPGCWLRIHSDSLEITRSTVHATLWEGVHIFTQANSRVRFEVAGHANGSALPRKGVMQDHTHQPTSTMEDSTHERKHGFWRTPWNIRCSQGSAEPHSFGWIGSWSISISDGDGNGCWILMYSPDLLLWNFTSKTWQTSFSYSF